MSDSQSKRLLDSWLSHARLLPWVKSRHLPAASRSQRTSAVPHPSLYASVPPPPLPSVLLMPLLTPHCSHSGGDVTAPSKPDDRPSPFPTGFIKLQTPSTRLAVLSPHHPFRRASCRMPASPPCARCPRYSGYMGAFGRYVSGSVVGWCHRPLSAVADLAPAPSVSGARC
jgi:hypothetical protein